MTERDLGNHFSWWIGEVVGVKDPDQSGRVQVRIFGRHDDTTNIPDDVLPWALPLQPVTSAAIGKVGTSPLGLLKGSKVLGFWLDKDQQYPVIIGSYGKAGDVSGNNTTAGGTETIDIKTGSMPTPAINQSDPKETNPYSKRFPGRKTIDEINNAVKPIIDKVSTSEGTEVRSDIDKDLKIPKVPTTASVDKSKKSDVLDLIKQVDPSKLGASLKNAVDNFSGIRNIMNITSPTGIQNMMSGALGGVLSSLMGQLGGANVMNVMMGMLQSGQLSEIAQNALRGGLADVMQSALQSPTGVPSINNVSSYIPQIIEGGAIPPVIKDIAEIPDHFVQQYYTQENDPYPGYIEYLDEDTNEVMYTLRGSEPLYASAMDHIMGDQQNAITSLTADLLQNSGGLDSIESVVSNTALVSGLSQIMNNSVGNISAMGVSKILGKGAAFGNMLNMAQKLIPQIASPLNMINNVHLPTSFLDQGSINKTLEEFTKNQALLKKQKDKMKKALDASAEVADQSFMDFAAKTGMSVVLSNGALHVPSVGGLTSAVGGAVGGNLAETAAVALINLGG